MARNKEILNKEIEICEYNSSNTKRLNLKVKILPAFGERKVGIKSWDEYPKDFEIHHIYSFSFIFNETLEEIPNVEW